MKKLFSIALVIAMAISCLAIFPSAAIEGDFILGTEFSEDGKTLYFTYELDMTMPSYEIETGAIDFVIFFDNTQLKALEGEDAFTFVTNAPDKDTCTWNFVSNEEGEIDCYIELEKLDDAATGAKKVSGTYAFEVLAEAGDEIVLTYDYTAVSFGEDLLLPTEDSGLTTVVPAAGAEEPEDSTTEEPEAPTYEAPAAAEYQTLAGCDVCKTPAGVRFIATVDAAADAYGMYITSGDKTVKLSNTDADFKVKAETADTKTFTAVIFSDLKFTVEVFEVYDGTEVKSVAGTN